MNAKINNTKELKTFLETAKVDIDEYAIFPDNHFPYETMGYITQKENVWEVGVYERGVCHNQQRFNTEAEACQTFLWKFFPEVLNGEE